MGGITTTLFQRPRDPQFNLTTLLLPGNGTNGAQNNTFLDSSSNNFSITRNGNTTQGTFSPFSQTGWSNYFDGTDDYLAVADNAVLRPGTSNFTLEAWIYRGASGAAHTIYAKGGASTGIVFQVTSTNVLRFTHTTTNIDSTGTIAANAWTHVAVVREGTSTNQTKLYINGTQDGQGTVSTDFTQTEEVRIGTNRGATDDFNGYISNLRFVKGTALYTGNFTPSTTPLTTTSQGATASEVELLTCQSNRFIDNSDNAFPITLAGTPSIQAFSPFLPTAAYSAATVGGSGYFDGTGDYLSIADNDALDMEASDFTIETWIYLTSTPATSVGIFGKRANTATFGGVNLYFPSNAAPALLATVNGSTWGVNFGSSRNIQINAWNHVAATRSGSTWTIWVNGLSGGTATLSGTVPNNTAAFTVAATSADGGQPLSAGYLSGFRVVKGTALYTGTFTPPTAPLTAITNTSLLLNFTNAGIVDSTAKNDLETVGNAQISTTQSKFGGSSIFFNGTTDYLRFPTSDLFAFRTGPWTVEFWVYTTSVTNRYAFVDTRSGTGSNAGITFYSNPTSGTIGLQIGTSLIGTSASGLPINQWNHLAVSASGTSVAVYLNGTSVVSGSYTQNLTEGVLLIGVASAVSGSYFSGYMDDIRISRVQRYTGNFNVPTIGFTDR